MSTMDKFKTGSEQFNLNNLFSLKNLIFKYHQYTNSSKLFRQIYH
jgi:hypothetical protein